MLREDAAADRVRVDAIRRVTTELAAPAMEGRGTLQSGGDINFTGFGKFHVAERGDRQGVNPRTRERITIKGGRVPRFTAGSALKQAVKGQQ